LQTAMVPVIPVPATAIASPSGHHSNTQQQRHTREALDTVTPSSHDNGIPTVPHRDAAIRLGSRWSTQECLGEVCTAARGLRQNEMNTVDGS
jgi:hypothetical protein